MDKSWTNAPITSKTFRDGAKIFISFARVRSIRGLIKCPCNKCCLSKWLDVKSAHGDILRHGFLLGYTQWTVHGEHNISLPLSQSTNVNVEETVFGQEDIRGLVRDALGIDSLPSDNTQLGDTTMEGDTEESAENGDHGDEGVSYKRLLEECDKELYAGCKYSNLSLTLHLYHIKCIGGISNKTFSMILELFRDAFPHLTALPTSTNEAKKFTKDLGLGYEKSTLAPMIVCFIRMIGWVNNHATFAKLRDIRAMKLYKCEKTTQDMRWHDTGRTKDGKVRHPADGLAWSAFNDRHLQFASDPRSVRLGLASDGFNPFGTMSTSHSTWPVLLVPYNLPPWICMKRQSFILSSIIPKEKVPSNDIDVYLKPLIKELQLLWKGVDPYDAFSKQHFKLKASLMCTINDFPANANLSGWSTNGHVACPVCANSTHSRFKYGKSKKRTREEDVGSTSTHAKEATHDNEGAFECTNTIIEKDIDDETLLFGWKDKRQQNTCKDLEEMRIRHDLHLINRPNGKPYLPPPCYTMSPVEKSNFLQLLKDLKVSYGYSSNISRGVSVKDHKISDLKRLRAKVLDPRELDKMEYQLVRTLCELEQIFPPSFFTVMVYLTVHLIYEAKLGGHVHYRWMYPVERYFEGVETPFNRPPRNDENVVGKEMYMFNSSGRKLGKVSLLQEENVDEEVLSLAIGPNIAAKQYKGFITNGYRFLTRRHEEFKKTQNSGVMVEVDGGYYYGKLMNIIELEYFRGYKIVLFQCDWVDNRLYRGLKKDKYGFPLVNFSRPLVHTGENLKDDPFIISTQARQVFYIEDLKDVGWSHVIMTKPRDIYDMGTNVNRDDDDSYTQCMPCNLPIMHDVNQEAHWRRRDTELQDA
ncbi:hypothetical protein Tco_1040328 [Tanacetum coccineum]